MAARGSAVRRRERRMRSWWRHEQASVKMALVTAGHHSCRKATGTEIGVQAGTHLFHDFDLESADTNLDVFDAPAPVTYHVAPATPATVNANVASAPVIGYIAPPSAATRFCNSLSLLWRPLPHKSLILFLPWTSLLRLCTIKSIRTRSLPSQRVLSVCNSRPWSRSLTFLFLRS